MNITDRELIKLMENFKVEMASERVRNKVERIEKFKRKNKFHLKITWSPFYSNFSKSKNKFGERMDVEKIKMEGWENANDLFDFYRKIGNEMKLLRIELFSGKEKVKGVKFTYKNGLENW